jgi:hypothetical protein
MVDRFNDPAFSTEARQADVGFVVNMAPSTLLEQLQDNGYERTTKPVGAPTTPAIPQQGTGGRGLTDTEAAFRLGANGINQ